MAVHLKITLGGFVYYKLYANKREVADKNCINREIDRRR